MLVPVHLKQTAKAASALKGDEPAHVALNHGFSVLIIVLPVFQEVQEMMQVLHIVTCIKRHQKMRRSSRTKNSATRKNTTLTWDRGAVVTTQQEGCVCVSIHTAVFKDTSHQGVLAALKKATVQTVSKEEQFQVV